MRDACRSLLAAGAVLLGLGALIALRVSGAPAAIAWATASSVCIAVGWGTFIVIAGRIAGDSKQLTKVLAVLPVVRMVAVGLLGWIVVGLLPPEAQTNFWVSVVAAYVATLTVETGLLARLVRRTAAAKAAEVQGAV